MSDFRLPRLPRGVAIAVVSNGFPTIEFQRWWQSVVDKIETQETMQDTLLAAVIAAQAAATVAQASAVTAQTSANTALAAANVAGVDIIELGADLSPARLDFFQ